MKKAWLLGALVTGAVLSSACSDDERPQGAPDVPSEGGDAGNGAAGSASGKAGGGAANGGGEGNEAGQAGSSSSAGAGSSMGGAGEGGAAGASSAGSSMGGMPEPIPPVGPTPLCVQGAAFGAGTIVSLSAAGDDLLQSITPDELTIAWRNGDDFFIAERADATASFGPPLEVLGGAQFLAISLRADGRLLAAVTESLTVVTMSRLEAQAFDAATAAPGDFETFNNTLAGSPEPNKVLTDAVLNANDSSFYYSYFSESDPRIGPSLRESRRDGGTWSFSSLRLGALLEGTPTKRRIPTGVSSDDLTLFYRDEVEGDFRAAWRVNTQVPFDHAEPVSLGTGTRAAAPSADCSKLYFSANGAADLDLFVSTRQ